MILARTYFYRVQAVREAGGNLVKAKLSAETQAAAAMSSTQLETCEALDQHSIRLTWQQASAADGYCLYRSTTENGTYKKIQTIKDSTVVTYTDTSAIPGKVFYYKICTYMQEEGQEPVEGELSACMSAKTQAAAPKLTSVRTDVGARSLVLAWERRTDVNGYRVFRSSYPDKKFVQIAEVANGVATGYEDRAVAPGSTYYYCIKALYTSGNYKGVSPASNIVRGNAAPGAPIGLEIRQTATDTLEIHWEKSPGAASYRLYRAEAGGGVYTCVAQGLAGTSYTDTQRKDGLTYFYRVSAVGAAGEGTRCLPVGYEVGGVSLGTRTLKVCVGVSKQLTLSTYRQGKVIWKSADPEIAAVDADGQVTGIAYGTVQVTATVAGKSASVTVSVTPGVKNGIDVSRWQEDVDWNRVKKSGVEFAFLRISNHYLEDYTFETKYQNASSVGMPLGAYCYSRATTVEQAQEEARVVLQILGGRKLDYPIALDMEDSVHKAMARDTLHQMILAFKQVVEDAGYRFVLYSYVTFLNSNLDKTRLDGIDLWLARYRNVSLGTGYTGTGNQKYWQYNSGQFSGSDFHVDGITDAYGNLVPVDVNVEY